MTQWPRDRPLKPQPQLPPWPNNNSALTAPSRRAATAIKLWNPSSATGWTGKPHMQTCGLYPVLPLVTRQRIHAQGNRPVRRRPRCGQLSRQVMPMNQLSPLQTGGVKGGYPPLARLLVQNAVLYTGVVSPLLLPTVIGPVQVVPWQPNPAVCRITYYRMNSAV